MNGGDVPPFDFEVAGVLIDVGGPAQIRLLRQGRLDRLLPQSEDLKAHMVFDHQRLAGGQDGHADPGRHAARRRHRGGLGGHELPWRRGLSRASHGQVTAAREIIEAGREGARL
jgi:hypothetical protein